MKTIEEIAREATEKIRLIALKPNPKLAEKTTAARAIIADALREHEQELRTERDAFALAYEGMKLGNENYAREVAELQADKARLQDYIDCLTEADKLVTGFLFAHNWRWPEELIERCQKARAAMKETR